MHPLLPLHEALMHKALHIILCLSMLFYRRQSPLIFVGSCAQITATRCCHLRRRPVQRRRMPRPPTPIASVACVWTASAPRRSCRAATCACASSAPATCARASSSVPSVARASTNLSAYSTHDSSFEAASHNQSCLMCHCCCSVATALMFISLLLFIALLTHSIA